MPQDNRRIKRKYVASMQPPQMAVELLGKAELLLRRAQRKIRSGEMEAAHNDLIDSQEIFALLGGMMKQDDEQGELASDFFYLVEQHCMRANLHKNAAMLDEVFPLLQRLQTICAYRLQKF